MNNKEVFQAASPKGKHGNIKGNKLYGSDQGENQLAFVRGLTEWDKVSHDVYSPSPAGTDAPKYGLYMNAPLGVSAIFWQGLRIT